MQACLCCIFPLVICFLQQFLWDFSTFATGSQPQYIVAATQINGQTIYGGGVIDGNGNFTLKLIKGKEYTFALYDQNGNLIGTLALKGSSSGSVKIDGDVNVSVDTFTYEISSTDPDIQPGNQRFNPKSSLSDLDGDGTPDEIEDNDSDRIPDSIDDYDCNGTPEALEHKDADHDGIPDYIDNDDDGDHVYDLYDRDDDGDGIEDDHDEEYEHGRCQAQSGGIPPTPPVVSPPPSNNPGGNTGNTTVSFNNDILPILNASCAGCHGGAGGFHLSTATDKWLEVTKFVDTANPANSKLLLKATNTISHGGGQVIAPNSQNYNTILQWIQAGAPNN